jgi:hypothetical protein
VELEPEDAPRVLGREPPRGSGGLGGGRLASDDRSGGNGRRRWPEDEEERDGVGEVG